MKAVSLAVLSALLLLPSCKKSAAPPQPSATSPASAEVPLGAAAALVPSGIESPEAAANAPTILALPPTTATLMDRHKLRLVVVLELDSPETRKEAEGRMHEFQDFVILILADRNSNDLLNSFARDDLRYAVFEAIRNALPPRGLKKVYFTEFVID